MVSLFKFLKLSLSSRCNWDDPFWILSPGIKPTFFSTFSNLDNPSLLNDVYLNVHSGSLGFHFFGFPRSSFLSVVAPHERWYKASGHAVHKLAYQDHQEVLLSSKDIQSLFYYNITQNSRTHSKQLSSMMSHLHWPQTPPFTGLEKIFTISWIFLHPVLI